MLNIRPAQASDAAALAPRLRQADLMSIRANSGRAPQTVLESGVRNSRPCCALLDERNEVLALFGVNPHPAGPGFGVVWLLGCDALTARPAQFLRTSKFWLARLQRKYAVLGNMVDARNTEHLRWLHWLGFQTVRRVERFGVEQRPFIEVRLLRPGAAPGALERSAQLLPHSTYRPARNG